MNTYYRIVNGMAIISKAGREYRTAVAGLVLEAGLRLHLTGRLAVRIEAWVPDKRKRDLDNILKATFDSLTHAGVWEDDSQIDLLQVRRCPVGGMLRIEVAEL